MDFAWDPAKAASNLRKHRVSFEEAKSVFADPLAISFEDEEHSDTEVREFISVIRAETGCCWSSFTERRDGIRLITARAATRLERQDYENQ